MSEYGLVSIIMPCYNAANYIGETIESVLAQTYTDWELLIVDDCSTDDSLAVIARYQDPRIRVLQNETNSGAAASRNYALREANGKWMAFLDSDDLWENEKLQKQLTFMIERDYHFSYTLYSQINEDSTPLGKVISGPRKVTKRKMFRYCYVGCLTVIYDREYVGMIQIDPSLKNRNDYAMWLKVSKICVCHLLNENLARYRIRGNSLSHSGLKKKLRGQYRLFRIGEQMPVIQAAWHTFINVVFGTLKKVVYVKSAK